MIAKKLQKSFAQKRLAINISNVSKEKRVFVNQFVKKKVDKNVTIKLMVHVTAKNSKLASRDGRRLFAKREHTLNVKMIKYV